MKHIFLLFITVLLLSFQSHAQNVAINNDGSDPDPSAALDVKATDKGVLIPRVDFSNLPLSPPTGLLVYVTANGPEGDDAFYYFDGTQWQKLSGAAVLENFTESNYTYDSKTGVKFTPDNAATDVDFVLQPKGGGAILAQQPDGTIAGGNNRGTYAVDLQHSRGNASQVASGVGSTILGGTGNTASGYVSTALGYGTMSSAMASTAMGYNTTASGNYSTAMGRQTTASGDFSTAMGRDAQASNVYAVAIGNNPIASGYASLAMGDYTTASGSISTAFGNRTTAPSAYETVLGRYNSDYTPSSTTDWIATDRLFVVGNGATDAAKSNALTILKSGNTGLGTDTPQNKLHIKTSGDGNDSKTFAIRLENDDFGSTATGLAFSVEGGEFDYAKAGIAFERTDTYARGKLHFLQSNASNSNDVLFSESVVTIDKTGYVGIGTTNPGSRLTLGNNVGDGFNEWTDYQLLLFTAPMPQNSYGIGIKASTLAFNTDSDFDFDQDGSTVMTIQSGNVGIGTTTTTQKLNVNGNVSIPAGSSYWIGNAADAGNRLRLHQTGSNAYIDWGEETLFFRSGVGAATNKVVFTADGKVGIGTTTPKATLDLGNSVTNRKISFYTTADNDHQFTGLGLNGDALRFQISNTAVSHKFYAGTSATTSTELFRIEGNGQIVIPALTTQGIVQNSATGLLSSTKGTANQVLKMNAAGTATEWASESDPTVPEGTQAGQMQYWNGSAWVTVETGTYGQVLEFRNGGPEWVDKNINTLNIGDAYQGGIIAYFLQSGDPGYDANIRHGFIASPADISTGASWGCMGSNVGDANILLGAGAQNTLSIVTGCSEPGIAARLCYDLVLNGYSDWFLPSGNELDVLYENKSAIGGFENTLYWSSTKINSNYAIAIDFTNGSAPYGIEKSSLRRVRAVRAF